MSENKNDETTPNNTKNNVTTIIFDVDDTLYGIDTGFTAMRNGPTVYQFMVDYLNFPNLESAKKLRDEYFEKYHATAKALRIAEEEGKLPPPDPTKPVKTPRFDPQDLSEYWVEHLDFSLLLKGGETGNVEKLVQDLKDCKLHKVAFSNGPRKYVQKVLETMGLWDTVFTEDTLFAVDDVLPYCKPEKEAFQVIFDKLGGVDASQCVLIEDSMKNIRQGRAMGMKTVLVTGAVSSEDAEAGLATKPGDAPNQDDPAVDIAMEQIDELRTRCPGLWENPAVFCP